MSDRVGPTAKRGDKIVFDGRGGYDHEKDEAAKVLRFGKVYTVVAVNVGPSRTIVSVEAQDNNFFGMFNSVLFRAA